MKTVTVSINVLNDLLDDSADTEHLVKNQLAIKIAREIIEELDIQELEHPLGLSSVQHLVIKKEKNR